MQRSPHELIEDIGAIVKTVWANAENPELLSKALNDIAVKHWALAVWRAELDEQERKMKAALDLDKAISMQEFVNDGEAVNKAEIKTTIKLAEQRKNYNQMAGQLEKVKVMLQANEKVMDSLRSRLSLIKENIKGV